MTVPSSSRLSPRRQRAAAVLAEVERVAASPVFGGPPRQIRLLRFLVGEVLEGRGGELRAPLIATRIFERPEGFDSTEDSIVRVEVSKLRRALDRHYAAAPPSGVRIELPRGSYAPVLVLTGAPAAPGSEDTPRASSRRPAAGSVLAVLPFTSMAAVSTVALRAVTPGAAPEPGSTGTRSKAFARGLTDRLCGRLALMPGVAVISRATTLDDAAGRGARYVLEGTVRLVPGALRVDAKLHDAERWLQIWAGHYDRLDADNRLFALEDEIAHEMTGALLAGPIREPS